MGKSEMWAAQYAGRGQGYVPVNLSLDREAAEVLSHVAPGFKSRGRFISRLIFEHVARQEERERLRAQISEVLDAGMEEAHVG
jgi:hypothetical protein